IYHIPIQTTAGLAHHYFISSDGTFENSIGWGSKGIEYKGQGATLNSIQQKRLEEYPNKFGEYNIYNNNCEMFAWYIVTGKRYSGQTQTRYFTALGAKIISLGQPVLTVGGMEAYQWEQAIAKKLNEDLENARRERWKQAQVETDDFWRKRDSNEI
ncbi:MAG: NC domain-containing protein, partial [Halothece sp. Uz-M2-17]|nr:NC domain-containing protein [Halothece sp. Uz-M2-17]